MELQALVNATNSEPGVRFYSVVRLSERPGEYQVHERYKDVSAMQEHLASEHLRAAMGRCAPLLVESPIIAKGTTLASLPYCRTKVDGSFVDVYAISVGRARLTFARTPNGLVTCGAINPAALDTLEIASVRVRPQGSSIANLDDILVAKVVEVNRAAAAFGVLLDMTGREALHRLRG
jgi:quinol monooxygenase YgiN/uncharacterized protein YunC (DUF1805 family)